jgi:DUF438 domain-containing protein
MAECKCKKMARLLRKLGATHAAAMHAKIGAQWSNEDWETHFREEETLILPLMRKAGMTAAVDRILREHRIMREAMRRSGSMPETMAEPHAAYEDDVVLLLAPLVKTDRRTHFYSSRYGSRATSARAGSR